ncbi:MAG: ABC transporter permease [Vampirovibrionales bacterium]
MRRLITKIQQQIQQWPPSLRWSLGGLALIYGGCLNASWVSPYPEHWSNPRLALQPPTAVYWQLPTQHGSTSRYQLTAPYVLAVDKRFNTETLLFEYRIANATPHYLQFCVWDATGFHLIKPPQQGGFHLLGTDASGRDVFSRVLYGGRLSLLIGCLSLLLTFPLGACLGGIAALFGGWVDTLLMRGSEVLMSIPGLFLLTSMAALLPASLGSTERFVIVSLLLSLVGWTGLARLTRSVLLSVINEPFMEAARTLGVGRGYLLIKHLLPQCLGFLVVLAALGMPSYILSEASLSLLGLGIQQPDASWGNLLREAQELSNLLERPWMMFPALLLAVLIFAYNHTARWLNTSKPRG